MMARAVHPPSLTAGGVTPTPNMPDGPGDMHLVEEDDEGMDTATRNTADTTPEPPDGDLATVADAGTDAVTETADSGTETDWSAPPTADDAPPPGDGITAPTGPIQPDRPEPRRGGWHIAAIVVGALMLLPATGLLTGGIALTVANEVGTDDGYFDGALDRIESNGVAVAAVDLWDEAADDEDWPWVLDWLDVDIRLRVVGAGPSDDVFVGIARSADVEQYLTDVEFSRLVDFDNRFPTYVEQTGAPTVDAPTEQDFWVASAAGPGEQELTWEARGGNWSAVVMNADGSPDVAADVEVGLRSGAITPIGVTLIVVGGVMLITSITLLVVGIRGRRR